MKPVDQTLFGKEDGNCLSACVASILEIELADVPNFCLEHDDWVAALGDWLGPFGLACVSVAGATPKDLDDIREWAKGYHIAGVTTSRGCKHAVVILDGKIVHDPHPSRNAMECEIEDVQLMLTRDAAASSRSCVQMA